MGAQTFIKYQQGADVQQAFSAARDDAAWEHGHGGYTGTLAEKDSYTIIPGEFTLDAAYKHSDQLIEDFDDRIVDKWGPAGAIRVKDPKHDGWLFFGWASS
jgi:hypothetical protein